MNRIYTKWALTALLAAAVGAQSLLMAEEQAESQSELPDRVVTLDSLSNLKNDEPQLWHVYAAPGVIYDDNINHLLINSVANSNTRLSDTEIYTSAGATLKPSITPWLLPTIVYNFERFDFTQHSDFSFYDHQLFASLHERLSQSWSLEEGVDALWYGDDSGLVTDDYTVYGGLRWKHWGFHGRFGYGYRRDGYVFIQDKDAHSNMAYSEISRYMGWNFLFLGYYYWRYHANADVFSFHSHFVQGGWTANWTPRFRTSLLLSSASKPYDGFDLRFNQTRYDQTYSASIKPSFALFPQLRLAGVYTYSANYSSAEVKRYYDHTYELLLEARF